MSFVAHCAVHEEDLRCASMGARVVGPDRIVRHAHKRFGERSIDYRHYLRELAKEASGRSAGRR
jgi:hypothetical protein